MDVDQVNVALVCRKLANGKYRWYGNGGDGFRKMGIPVSSTLTEAKSALCTTYPPPRYNLQSDWS